MARSPQTPYDIYNSDSLTPYDIYNMGCIRHDGRCYSDHGKQGQCCGGTYCHKNDPAWAEGRCYNIN